jgi:heat shock protein HslJ
MTQAADRRGTEEDRARGAFDRRSSAVSSGLRGVSMKASGALMAVLLLSFPAAAAEPRMTCFGNEPSWGLQFTGPGTARLLMLDAPPVAYLGSETRLDFLRERAWRGKPAAGGGDLVAFLRDSVCSDGMSDEKHPVTARVSLPDGRFLAGCCRVVPASAEAAEAAKSIEGPIWRLTDLRGLDPSVLRDMTPPVTAGFKAGRISGFSGCNQFFGPYTLDRDRVTIGPLAGSMMACDQPRMKVENAVHAALAGTFRYVLSDDSLTLLSGNEAILKFRAEPAPALEGVTWKITGFNNGRQAVVSPLLGTTLSMTFKGGWVEGFAGCNTFRATYAAQADRIAIGPAAVTRKSCGGEGVMQQEREFLSALESTTTWGSIGKLLDMHRADGERTLTATGN